MEDFYPAIRTLVFERHSPDNANYTPELHQQLLDEFTNAVKNSFAREFSAQWTANMLSTQLYAHIKNTAPKICTDCEIIVVSKYTLAVISRKRFLIRLLMNKQDVDRFVREYSGAAITMNWAEYIAGADDRVCFHTQYDNVVCEKTPHGWLLFALRGLVYSWCHHTPDCFARANDEILRTFDALRVIDATLPQPIAEEIHAFFH